MNDWWSGLAPRERRVVSWGAMIATLALAIVYAVVPFARNWRVRETSIQAARQQLAALEGLVRDAPSLRAAADAEQRAIAQAPQRLFSAASPALAAAGAQSLLQEYADRSRVTITRLDAAAGLDSTTSSESVRRLPITLTGTTDIFGVAELLGQLMQGARRLDVEQLTVQTNPALRGAPDVLQLTLSLSAPWVVTP
jgi:general secretion pathway protein M